MEQNTKEMKLKIPEGFRNLLEALTCEILRVQPKNIPKFAAEYLKGRLIARQGSVLTILYTLLVR